MANLLKKVTIGNPLFNLGLIEELVAYENAKTDEELVNVYHQLLDKSEKLNAGNPLEQLTYAMIGFSTNLDINAINLINR